MNNTPLIRGQTAQAVAERKEPFASPVQSALMLGGGCICIVLGFLYVMVGYRVDAMPEHDCDHPWSLWYKVEGALTVVEGLLAIKLFMDLKNVMLGPAGDNVLKAQVYAEQQRTIEQQAASAQAMQEPGAAMAMAAIGAETCCVCCVSCFDLGWMIWGIVMAFSNAGCEEETNYLWYLLGASIFINIVQKIIKKTAGK